MSKDTVFESGLSLISISYIDQQYYYSFAESDLRGPFCEEREVYQESMREMASVLKGALIALHHVEQCVAEIREPFQDLRRITEI